jgi:Xaa-Pro aminopeptidase
MRLKKLLSENNLEAFLCLSRQRIYYLSGYEQEDAYLLATPKSTYLITDSRYQEEAKSLRPKFKVIISSQPLKEVIELAKKYKIKNLGIEDDRLNYHIYALLKKQLRQVKIKPASGYVASLILIKDKQEIKAITQACRLAEKALLKIKTTAVVGKSEIETAAYLKHYLSTLGSEVADYEPIVASGARSALPHARTTTQKIKKGDNLLIDLGAKVYGYNSDLTRVYSFSKMKAEYKRIYSIVKNAQTAAINLIKPGAKASDIDRAAREVITAQGYGKEFIHATGHGVGLDIHEKPSISLRSQDVLKPGMVFSIEPGIYIKGKFGIRLEDIVTVTQKGYKILSHDIAHTV